MDRSVVMDSRMGVRYRRLEVKMEIPA